jgi:predicted secreted protein
MSLNSSRRLRNLNNMLTTQKLVDVAYDAFVKNTPIRSGNARRKTNKKADGVEANYPYAKRLDEGYSKQSPKGMIDPTRDAVRSYINKQLGK